ncbi:MAG TPA: amino acid deaminase/aldolase [Ktedonobacteraceae bacterium]|nr:amino acid deaminase/aldolase [Ktedonobacteraceae bacterium]
MRDQQLAGQDEQTLATEDVEGNTVHRSLTSIQEHNYAYYKSVFGSHPMPFAYVDLDLLEQNIRQVVARAKGKRVRLASKSLRCIAITRRILASDACFQGLMCFTAREAVYMAAQGFDDLLIGYPVYNEQDIATIARATADGAHITLMVDCLEHVEQIEKLARQHDVRLPLCLEIDMSMDVPGLHFGVWRSSLRTVEQARPVVKRIMTSQSVWLDGLMGYEAQIAGLGDNFAGQKLKNTLVRQLKRRSIHEIADRRATLVEMIGSYGIALRFVNGGGTGSIDSTRAEDVVTEITVGSAFYAPALFDNYRNFRYRPAAGFAIEIVRHPQPAIYTCLGGGYIASGSAGSEKLPQPYLPEGATLDALEGAGEVQTPIRYDGPATLKIGDPIFMRHSKAGELCERFSHLLCVQDGRIVDEVTTYRGDGQCFL